MKGEAYIYKTDGSNEHLDFTNPPDLKVLQDAVGGHIETVPYWVRHRGKPCVAFCNEEGKIHGLTYNAKADMAWALERSAHVQDHLYGNVIVLMGDREFMGAL